MRFHQTPEPYGYYGDPGMGYYAEAPEAYGYYAQPPEAYGYYAEPPPDVGYYAEPPEPYGYYAYGEMPPDMGYYAEYPELSAYGEMPEMVGYHEYEPLAEDYSDVADYGEPDVQGYVREVPPAFNAGCPLPTNVAGWGEPEPMEGYINPQELGPTCSQIIPGAAPTSPLPDTLKPLW